MKNRVFYPFVIFCFSFSLSLLNSSCGSNPYPGYREIGNGFYFKLISFGDSERKIKNGDMVTVNFAVLDSTGKLVRDSGYVPCGKETFLFSDSLEDYALFAQLSEGDSASVIRPGRTKPANSSYQVRVLKVQAPAEYEAEQKHIAEAGDIDENKALKEFLEDERSVGLAYEEIGNGLYCLPEKKGSGESVKAGKMISVKYKGYFMDGRQFDATKPGQPLEFVYGSEMQVIEGLQMAMGRMRQGDKSKIIIPSHFAYGEKGSSTGIVPPFTTLIYEVEIVSVK